MSAISNLSQWTIELFIYVNSFGSESYPFLFHDSSINMDEGWAVRTNQKFSWITQNIYHEFPSTFNINQWYNLAATWNGTNLKMYQDNILVYNQIVAAGWTTVNTGAIGAYWSNGLGRFDGYIKNLRISNIVRTSFPTLD